MWIVTRLRSAPLAAVTLTADWMVTLVAPSSGGGASPSALAAGGHAGDEVLECWRRSGAGQLYSYACSQPLRPMLNEYLNAAGAAPRGNVVHVADIAAVPADASGGASSLVVLIAMLAADGSWQYVPMRLPTLLFSPPRDFQPPVFSLSRRCVPMRRPTPRRFAVRC